MRTFRPALHLVTLFLAVASSLFAQGTDPLPMLGMNVNATDDWGRMYLFADAMKQSRGWGSPTAPWDLAAPVDASGWPTADAGVVVLSNGVHIAGSYHLTFTGTAIVASLDACGSIRNRVFDIATNTTRADLVVDATARQIMLSFTATRGGVRNVRLMRPGCTNETFTREYLALIAPYACLRLNSYAGTNGGWTSDRGPWSRTGPTARCRPTRPRTAASRGSTPALRGSTRSSSRTSPTRTSGSASPTSRPTTTSGNSPRSSATRSSPTGRSTSSGATRRGT